MLPAFVERYDVALSCRTIAPPDSDAVSQPGLYRDWELADAMKLAQVHGLEVPRVAATEVDAAHGRLEGLDGLDYVEAARELGARLFAGEAVTGEAAEASTLDANLARLHGAGHYLPGVLSYAGEHYWSVGRLPLLERRLEALGAGEGSSSSTRSPTPVSGRCLEVWLSARSPYSYLAISRIEAIVAEHDLELIVRPILPMVMRGIPAPRRKRFAILFDAAREAMDLCVPFGRICDPLGPGVERVLAICPLAEREGLSLTWLNSAMTGIWAEGIEVAEDAGLQQVVERAGLDWAQAEEALADDSWRAMVEANRQALMAEGLWGVPSFKLSGPGTWTAWGQDRLWILRAALEAS
ncbi:MAG TPA: DsbA family protein [Myxococcota bacterium]|nr:DsbA family protein [Myxococcota bacterium]